MVDGQIVVPATAAERLGIQPVVSLTANGAARAEVPAGRQVKFSATIELPPNTGKVVSAEWDFDGAGAFAESAKFTPGARVTLKSTHTFAKPGTYFVTLRAASQREGDAKNLDTTIANLARVRVVVR